MKLRAMEFKEKPKWLPWELEWEVLCGNRAHAIVIYHIPNRKWTYQDIKRRDLSEGRKRAISDRIPPVIIARCVTASLGETWR